MQRKVTFSVLIMFMILLFSCSSARRGKTLNVSPGVISSKERVLELSFDNNFVNKGVIIRNGKAHLESDLFTGNFDFYAKINSVGDYFISGMGPLGIEVVRIYGIRDSSYVVDRINKRVYLGKSSKVYAKFGLPSDFIKLLLGDIPEKATLANEVSTADNEIKAYFTDSRYECEYTIDRNFLRASKAVMINNYTGESVDFYYNDFEKSGVLNYPGRVEINSEKPLFHVEIYINNLESPVNEMINIKLPDYKRVGL